MSGCGYKPGPAELAYYAARQEWRDHPARTFTAAEVQQDRIVELFRAMAAERKAACA